jgi:hypothetical protein
LDNAAHLDTARLVEYPGELYELAVYLVGGL